jgi:3-oxoacyl-[acyl-carrier protein] reductase
VVCDIDPDALAVTGSQLAALGVEHLALRCDVSDAAAVDAMFVQAGVRFGTVDILVNNAARVPSSPAEAERRNRHHAYATWPAPARCRRTACSR